MSRSADSRVKDKKAEGFFTCHEQAKALARLARRDERRASLGDRRAEFAR